MLVCPIAGIDHARFQPVCQKLRRARGTVAQPEKIFACPACGHIWGAHASRVLVSESRRNKLCLCINTSEVVNIEEKSAIAGTRSPPRGTRALPRISVRAFILFPARPRPVRYRFLAGGPEFVRASRSANSC